ncbi:MAG: hypothetical protein ABI759_01155 [Candidatus Solibacter sp.]
MTKARSQKTALLRPACRVNLQDDQAENVCEQIVAELQARRVRLKELLHLVLQEVEQRPVAKAPARRHTKHHAESIQQIA